MRILDRGAFLNQPEGVLFAKYEKTGLFGGLCVKHDTMIGFDGTAQDFRYQNCMEIQADGTEEWLDSLTEAEDNGASFSLDLECGSRDGLFDKNQLFVVFERDDLNALHALIGGCIPAVFPEPNKEHETEKQVPTSPLTKLLDDAPRCYYNYDPTAGRRPCTIDIERYHGDAFKQSGLPSCPFKDACFTRSDCLYITGNQVSESEGAAQVAKELRQMDWRVEKLTKENTQTLRPYL